MIPIETGSQSPQEIKLGERGGNESGMMFVIYHPAEYEGSLLRPFANRGLKFFPPSVISSADFPKTNDDKEPPVPLCFLSPSENNCLPELISALTELPPGTTVSIAN